MNPLETINPIDGRYRKHTQTLAKYFNQVALIHYRVEVEMQYLLELSRQRVGVRRLSKKEIQLLKKTTEISLADAKVVNVIEWRGYKKIPATNHDMKAVEYFLKEKLERTSLRDVLEWIHFSLTSEDVNNVAYGLMLRDALEQEILPALEQIQKELQHFAKMYGNVPMLARTHGQPASPTTFGKEFRVFSARLERQCKILCNRPILVKLNGATGNYNAHVAAFPKVNWVKVTEKFVNRLNGRRKIKLEPNVFTTQIEPHDTYAELFDNLRRINTILLDFSQDIWRYVSDGWIGQKAVEGEVGSSTMPHKINPIKFENAEGNLGIANALCSFFSTKLPISRLQRDLSDSTVERNFGAVFAYSLVAYRNLLEGIGRIAVNTEKVAKELQAYPEIVTEGIQTILRREGIPMPYEKLKALTRGKRVTFQEIHTFVDSLDIALSIKEELKRLTPKKYIGLAKQLATKKNI